MSEFAEKVRSLHFAGSGRARQKVVVDDHGTHRVKVTTSDERQDVHVKAGTVRVRPEGTVTDGHHSG